MRLAPHAQPKMCSEWWTCSDFCWLTASMTVAKTQSTYQIEDSVAEIEPKISKVIHGVTRDHFC